MVQKEEAKQQEDRKNKSMQCSIPLKNGRSGGGSLQCWLVRVVLEGVVFVFGPWNFYWIQVESMLSPWRAIFGVGPFGQSRRAGSCSGVEALLVRFVGAKH